MKALLFDLDGTLTKTFYADDQSYLKALNKQIAIDTNYNYWSECSHLTDEYVLHYFFNKEIGRNATLKERTKMQADFLGELRAKHLIDPDFFEPIPGAVEFINNIVNNKVPCGVATGGWYKMAKYKLNIAGFNESLVVVGSDANPTKVEFLGELKRLVCPTFRNSDCVYIGDSKYDLDAATQLGMQFIGLDFKQKGTFDYSDVKHVFTDFKNQSEWMNTLNNLLEET